MRRLSSKTSSVAPRCLPNAACSASKYICTRTATYSPPSQPVLWMIPLISPDLAGTDVIFTSFLCLPGSPCAFCIRRSVYRGQGKWAGSAHGLVGWRAETFLDVFISKSFMTRGPGLQKLEAQSRGLWGASTSRGAQQAPWAFARGRPS